MEIDMKIKLACTYAKVSEAELARRIGTSPQNLHKRLKVGRFSMSEMSKMADALGAKFVLNFEFPDGTNI